jgi:hypothetical protein
MVCWTACLQGAACWRAAAVAPAAHFHSSSHLACLSSNRMLTPPPLIRPTLSLQ